MVATGATNCTAGLALAVTAIPPGKIKLPFTNGRIARLSNSLDSMITFSLSTNTSIGHHAGSDGVMIFHSTWVFVLGAKYGTTMLGYTIEGLY